MGRTRDPGDRQAFRSPLGGGHFAEELDPLRFEQATWIHRCFNYGSRPICRDVTPDLPAPHP